MTLSIDDLRLSFIWTEASNWLLTEPQPDVPYKKLGRPFSYRSLFEDIDAGVAPDGLGAPWNLEFSRRFWNYYGKRRFGAIPAGQAWHHLVPVHVKVPLEVTCDGVAEPFDVQGYLYPFAIAVEIAGRLDGGQAGSLEPKMAIGLAQKVYYGQFNVATAPGKPVLTRLDPLASRALAYLRNLVYGVSDAIGEGPAKPFSVATFVRLTGVDPLTPTPADGPIHRTLEALSTWSRAWEKSTLRGLKEHTAEILSSAPPSHLLYADKRSRVGWFPSEPPDTDPENRRLACYHRHQVFAMLQLEALGYFVKGVAQRVEGGEKLWAAEEECARNAAGILGRLYGGSDATYRSDSCRLYLDQNDLVDAVNTVRKRYNQSKLHVR